MAQKRMFDKDIVSQDRFTEMSSDAQSLYFHLGVHADDDGFVSPKGVMRLINVGDDSLRLLVLKGFVIPFESGVVVITNWNQNNYIDRNRYKPTQHQDELKSITLTATGKYELNTRLTSIEESRVDKNRILGEASLPPGYSRGSLEGDDAPRTRADTTYRSVFELWGPKYPLNWRKNRSQIEAAKNILTEHGLQDAREALQFALKHQSDAYCPQITSPFDLDAKWDKLAAYSHKK